MIEDSLLKRILIYLERYYQLSDGDEMEQLRTDINRFRRIVENKLMYGTDDYDLLISGPRELINDPSKQRINW